METAATTATDGDQGIKSRVLPVGANSTLTGPGTSSAAIANTHVHRGSSKCVVHLIDEPTGTAATTDTGGTAAATTRDDKNMHLGHPSGHRPIASWLTKLESHIMRSDISAG